MHRLGRRDRREVTLGGSEGQALWIRAEGQPEGQDRKDRERKLARAGPEGGLRFERGGRPGERLVKVSGAR